MFPNNVGFGTLPTCFTYSGFDSILLNKDINLSKSDAIFSNSESIKEYDHELWTSFEKEAVRQEDHIELIASENYASQRILEAQGSLLTNKYAEGYPSKR